jgi:hypothetical protein
MVIVVEMSRPVHTILQSFFRMTTHLLPSKGGATTTPSLEGELKGVREYQSKKTPAIPGGWH